ncbi:tyrosine-type recombinase/integrase [Paenibacillus sp. LjRoot56]|uniref:tyrosine-type recombinase/integrase n=1 Tax=Paenibacillus sp. LjRoot56 TaxID=3342333 RepID=UPI003F508864
MGTHTLRKTFGYFAYKAGTDIVLLQQIFNHSSPSVTLRYIGILQDDMDNVIINLNL